MQLRVGRAVHLLMLFGQREALDHLAGVVQAEHIGARADADRRDRLLEAEVPQHVHGIGADLDAGADLAELRRLLVDFDVVAGLHQAGGRRQPADPGAGDENSILAACLEALVASLDRFVGSGVFS